VKPISKFISQLRHEFSIGELSEKDVAKLPDLQFEKWMKQAVDAEIEEAQAMTLCTVSENNRPHSRVVYLRGFENNQFRFYGNYHSVKGKNLSHNPHASLNFFWYPLQRQVRIEGVVSKLSPVESDEYFSSRPRDSQIGAWVSEQSSVITSRGELEKRITEFEQKFMNQNVPCPPHWGGWRLEAGYYEFWQGRPGLYKRKHPMENNEISPLT